MAPQTISPQDQDWDHIYQLALRYDQYRNQGAEETKNPNSTPVSAAREQAPKQRHQPGDKQNIKSSLEGLMGGTNYTVKCDWLAAQYFDQYLVENAQFCSLTLDYNGQGKLFQRFDRKDDEQRKVAHKFVQALLQHPRASEITALRMADARIPDVFLIALAEQCSQTKGLPKLQVLNLESNLIGQEGVIALSTLCLADPTVWRFLQVLKLDNQKLPLGTDAEQALGEALLQNQSLVAVSLRVQSGLARQQVNNSVSANIDKLRQARRQHATATGTLKERKRNEMELYFDQIADNTKDVTEVNLVANVKFLGLNPKERTKAATAFATNTTVKTIKLIKLQLDDTFAQALGQALHQNSTLTKICLDSNSMSGTGIQAILQGLAHNSSVFELEVRHQSKTMSSADEEGLPGLLAENKTLTKLGIDVRASVIKTQLERKTNENREYQRKLRVSQRNNNK